MAIGANNVENGISLCPVAIITLFTFRIAKFKYFSRNKMPRFIPIPKVNHNFRYLPFSVAAMPLPATYVVIQVISK